MGTPPELISGDAANGQIILSGSVKFGRRRYSLTELMTYPESVDVGGSGYFHGFEWLRNLRSVGDGGAQSLAVNLVSEWVSLYQNWETNTWKAEIIGERISNWLINFVFITGNNNAEICKKLYMELGRQSAHLSRVVLSSPIGEGRFKALKGLIYAGVSIPNSDHYLLQGLRIMEKEVAYQIHPDGGHISRSPETQMRIFRYMLEVRQTLYVANIDVPEWVGNAIEKMEPMLKCMLLGDGALSFFHGGGPGNPKEIEMLLKNTSVSEKTLLEAPYTGYQRLSAGSTIVIVDVGDRPVNAINKFAHNGILSFEMSVNKERLIVNCGSQIHLGPKWNIALKETAAHSTVMLDGNIHNHHVDRELKASAQMIRCSRREFDGNLVLDAISHKYKSLNLIHRRIITMLGAGGEVHGEDKFIGKCEKEFCIRFHLHPNVQATLLQRGETILLKPRRGAGWKFSTTKSALSLEESIYCGDGQRIRRTSQIVIRGNLDGGDQTTNWNIKKI